MHLFDKRQYRALLKEARRNAKDGVEVCGLMVDTRFHISLVPTRNVSRRTGSFVVSVLDVRRIVHASEILGQQVVGTFHSHPIGFAKPGPSDIANTVDGSLMLILDCIVNEGVLWRIKSGRSRRQSFGFVQGS
jgi:proteasome lid subunit RPN8/RPN11